MNNRQLAQILRETLTLQEDLYDFCIECLERIYPDNHKRAKGLFEDGYNFREYNGCIQSLSTIDSHIRIEKKQLEDFKAKQDQLKGE